jgi:NTP pyrophosphatase (non-canonical NTP hydrolase)
MQTWQDYAARAQRTRNDKQIHLTRRETASASLFEEVGEFAGKVKKYFSHGHDRVATQNGLQEEGGDIMWYVAEICAVWNLRFALPSADNKIASFEEYVMWRNAQLVAPPHYDEELNAGYDYRFESGVWFRLRQLREWASNVDALLDGAQPLADDEEAIADLDGELSGELLFALRQVVFFTCAVMLEFGVTLSMALAGNLDKLIYGPNARYPNGFESKRSIERTTA